MGITLLLSFLEFNLNKVRTISNQVIQTIINNDLQGDRILHNMHDANLLVHGGAGSLGQAVISVAFALGYQVFTTVSDIKKKRFLLKLFPQLKGIVSVLVVMIDYIISKDV